MTVLYYTQTYYLDATLETIKSLQETDIDLHLMIELTPDSKKSNIVNINNLSNIKSLSNLTSIIGKEQASLFNPYFKKLKSVHFLVYHKKSTFSIHTLLVTFRFLLFKYKIKPDIIHFDTISLRSLLFLPFLFNLKKVMTIHDPIAHIGEHSWKTFITQKIFYTLSNGFVFYSDFAKKQFENTFRMIHVPHFVLKFQPFTFNQYFMKRLNILPEGYILFFGRVSFYKGIDLLMEAIPIVLKCYPKQQFIIAGKSDGYQIDDTFLKKYSNNLLFINQYFTVEEAVEVIQHAKFIVCPYRDASQSGVLMTANALGKTVLATSVGAFPEYIKNGIDGLITTPIAKDIADHILFLLNNDRYRNLENNVITSYSKKNALLNRNLLLAAYSLEKN